MRTLNLFIAVLIFAPLANAAPIPNLLNVDDSFFRGARPGIEGMRQLRALGIKTVINLQGGDLENPLLRDFIRWWEPGETPEAIALERRIAEATGMAFFNMPLNSMREVTEAEDREIDRVLELLQDPSRRPVYLHCEHGKDRTGLIAALYRIKVQGWSVDQAYAEWAALGHSPFSAIFTGALDRYFFKKAASWGKTYVTRLNRRHYNAEDGECALLLRRST